MPNSALQRLTKMNAQFPVFFRVTCPKSKKKTYVGVLEFVAEEGNCYIPGWVFYFAISISCFIDDETSRSRRRRYCYCDLL
jgi:hypothetical protein